MMKYENAYASAALFMGEKKPFEVRSYPVTPPATGYALVKLLATGICGTDVHIHCGRLGVPSPLIIGHEFIGEIADVNPAGEFKPGDRVIVNFAKPCGECALCKAGDSANCTAFEVTYQQDPEKAPHFFGGYGEYCYARADHSALIKIPEGIDPMAAAMFPCAGPTILHALKLGGIFANSAEKIKTAVVQGAGPLGLFSCLWLKQQGVQSVYAVLRDKESPRAEAIRALTGSETLTGEELKAKVSEGLTVDLCIECSGNPAAVAEGIAMLRNRGIYLVPGQYSNSGAVEIQPQLITFKALQIYGSSQYDATDVADYIRFLDENRAICPKIAGYVKAFPVGAINEAMEAAHDHRYSKVVLV